MQGISRSASAQADTSRGGATSSGTIVEASARGSGDNHCGVCDWYESGICGGIGGVGTDCDFGTEACCAGGNIAVGEAVGCVIPATQ